MTTSPARLTDTERECFAAVDRLVPGSNLVMIAEQAVARGIAAALADRDALAAELARLKADQPDAAEIVRIAREAHNHGYAEGVDQARSPLDREKVARWLFARYGTGLMPWDKLHAYSRGRYLTLADDLIAECGDSDV